MLDTRRLCRAIRRRLRVLVALDLDLLADGAVPATTKAQVRQAIQHCRELAASDLASRHGEYLELVLADVRGSVRTARETANLWAIRQSARDLPP